MGRNEIEPREGGRVRWSIGGFTAESTVTAWDPPSHFVSTGDEMPDGSMHRFDYRVDPRGEPELPGHVICRTPHALHQRLAVPRWNIFRAGA